MNACLDRTTMRGVQRQEKLFGRLNKRAVVRSFHLKRGVICGALLVLLCVGASLQADDLFVAIKSSNSVQQFDSEGNSSFYDSSLNGPIGITFDLLGNLYVGNWNDGNIFKYDPHGVKTLFANVGQYQCMGLVCDTGGNLFVARYNAGNVVRYDTSGDNSVVASGIYHPRGLAMDSAGSLYVTSDDNTIRKITAMGVLSVFADTGLNRPAGLAFDSEGNLYAANYFSMTVTRFTPDGQGTLFASTGSGYSNPLGIAFDSQGYLYAVLAGNAIAQFDMQGDRRIFASTANGPYFIAVRPIPEPTTLSLLGLGSLVLVLARQRR